MFFGRNEEAGLRCVYHGWKFDITGACVDMPSEPPESNFKSRYASRPTRRATSTTWSGSTWARARRRRPSRSFEIITLPDREGRAASIMMEEANWFQNLEGDIDSSHIDYLHARLDAFRYAGR